jgi:hypothetical protein
LSVLYQDVKRLTPIRGFVSLKMLLLKDELPEQRIDPTYFPLKPPEAILRDDEKDPSKKLVREVQEFPMLPALQPHSHYVHNLYVYPLKCDLPSKFRNISIRVQLRLTDWGNHNEMNSTFRSRTFDLNAGLLVIKLSYSFALFVHERAGRTLETLYSPSSSAVFTSQLLTGVTYHNSSPHFLDEMKILLPYGIIDSISVIRLFLIV